MVCARSSLVRLIDRGVAEITGCEANPKGMDIIFIKKYLELSCNIFFRNGCKNSASARDTKESGQLGEMKKVRKRRKRKKNRVSNVFLFLPQN